MGLYSLNVYPQPKLLFTLFLNFHLCVLVVFAGYSPLCQAVWQQEKEIVQMLLEAGARLTHSDRLLHCSILHRCPDIAKLLISAGSIVNLRDDSGDTPLIIAARTGQVNMVNLLLKNGELFLHEPL